MYNVTLLLFLPQMDLGLVLLCVVVFLFFQLCCVALLYYYDGSTWYVVCTVLYGTGTSRLQQVHSVRVETFLIYFSLPFLQLSSMIHTYSIHTCNIMNIGFTIIINN